MTRCLFVATLLSITSASLGQELVIPIWPGAAPGSENWRQKEVAYDGGKMIRNVVRPTLTAYLPPAEKATGAAVVVCPGGGFRFHSWQNEGTAVAEWLRDHGVAAFVLKYRTVDMGTTEEEFQKNLAAFFTTLSKIPGGPKDRPPAELNVDAIIDKATEDGRQAIRVLRKRAAEWKIDPKRIGIMGFSAGGVVASGVAVRHDAESAPSFVGNIYGPPFGKETVPADAAPLFILCASDDPLAAFGCAYLYIGWREAGKPAEIHVYDKGGHGFGMSRRGLPVDTWIERFGEWLGGLGLLKRP